MNKLIFLDTETTGTDRKKSGVYQIAGIIECDGKAEEFDLKCNIFENDFIDQKAFESNKMSIEKIMTFPDPKDTFNEFIELLSKYIDRYNKNDKFTAIGYFSEFDAEMLRNWFIKNGDNFFGSWFWHPFLDVSQLVAYVYQDNRDLFTNFKLSTVAYMLEVTNEKDEGVFHDALFDAKITRDIYWKLDKILRGE